MTAIHRINPEIFVTTPLGPGRAVFLIDYGASLNTVWVVALDSTGSIIHVDAGEIRIAGNEMYNIRDPEPFTERQF